MPPRTPQQIKWDWDSLANAAGVIQHTARDIEISIDAGEIPWRDPSVRQTSSGGAVLQFAPIDGPKAWEECVAKDVNTAIHNLMPLVTRALANLAKQTDYAAEGLVRMANGQEGTEDSSVVSIFDAMDKSFDHPRRG
jgi:hypothetical protein